MASTYQAYPQGNATVYSAHDRASTALSSATVDDQTTSGNQVMLPQGFQIPQHVNLPSSGVESSGVSTYTSQSCTPSNTTIAWSSPEGTTPMAAGGKQNETPEGKEKKKKTKKPKDPNEATTNPEQKKKKKKADIDPNTGEEIPQRWWCEPCSRGFFSAYNLRRHQKNVHKADCPSPRGSSETLLSPRLSSDSQFSPTSDPSHVLVTTAPSTVSSDTPTSMAEQILAPTTVNTVYTVSSDASSSMACPPPSSIATTQLSYSECPSTPFTTATISGQQNMTNQVISIPCAAPPVQTLPEVNYVPVTKTNAVVVQATGTSAPLVSTQVSHQSFQSGFYSFVTSMTTTNSSNPNEGGDKPQEQQPTERRQSLDDIEQMLLEDVAWNNQEQDQTTSKPQCTVPYEPEQAVATQVVHSANFMPASVCNLNDSLVDTYVSAQENTASGPAVFVAPNSTALIQSASKVNSCPSFENDYKDTEEPGGGNNIIMSECKETQVDSESFEQFSSNVENGCENFENVIDDSTLNIGGKSYVCKESQTVGELDEFGLEDVPTDGANRSDDTNGKAGLEQVLCSMQESYKELETVTGSVVDKGGNGSSTFEGMSAENSAEIIEAGAFSMNSAHLMPPASINTQINTPQTNDDGITGIGQPAQILQGALNSQEISVGCDAAEKSCECNDQVEPLSGNLESGYQVSLCNSSSFTGGQVPQESSLLSMSKETQVDEAFADSHEDENGTGVVSVMKDPENPYLGQIGMTANSCDMLHYEKSGYACQDSGIHDDESVCKNLTQDNGSVFQNDLDFNGNYDTKVDHLRMEHGQSSLNVHSETDNVGMLITANLQSQGGVLTNHVLTPPQDSTSTNKEIIPSFCIPNAPDVNNDTCQSVGEESNISAGNRSNESDFEFSLQASSVQGRRKSIEDHVISNSEDSVKDGSARSQDEDSSVGAVTRGRTRHRESTRKRNCPCCDDASPKSAKKCRSNSSESGSTSADDRGHPKHGVNIRLSQKAKHN